MEIRLYFECLEQAYHYVYPLIQTAIQQSGVDATVKLIRKPRALRGESTSLYAIYSLTTPDFLITLCAEDKEIPLITGEFSEAVFTEDHEFQRSLVGIASALAGCIHLKISGQKESPREHGGGTRIDPLTIANAVRQILKHDGYIITKWPTRRNNPYVLHRNSVFLSCPPGGAIPLAEETIKKTVIAALQNYSRLLNGSIVADITMPYLRQAREYRLFQNEIGRVGGLNEIKQIWMNRSQRYGRRARIYLSDDKLIVKINRFSHAADPDRGILTFASLTVRANETMARYVVKKRARSLDSLFDNFMSQASNEGIPEYFLSRLRGYVNRLPRIEDQMDITTLWSESQAEWQNNKVLSSLAFFADGLIVQDLSANFQLSLKWNRSALIMRTGEPLEHSLIRTFGFREYGTALMLNRVDDINEDEVTYVVVHRILRPNGFEVVSTSYPGAQGDAAILPERGTGRRQRRLYLDVIAWLPYTVSGPSSDLTLEESKDRPYKRALQEAIQRLQLFKTDSNMLTALKETLRKMDFQRELKRIYIGVGFGARGTSRTFWQPARVDFIVRIIERNRWDVAFFGNDLRNAFKNLRGSVNLPDVSEVVTQSQSSTLTNYMQTRVSS